MARLSFSRVSLAIVSGVIMFCLGYFLRGVILESELNVQLISPLPDQQNQAKENIYEVYSFPNLEKTVFSPQPLTVVDQLDSTPQYTSFLVAWQVPDLKQGINKKVSGQLNIPNGSGPFPVIVMLRGYAEREQYQTGLGTRNAAAALAQQGFITIAPDFLGYGQSDPEDEDILLARFSRPVTVLQLLANLTQPTITVSGMASLDQEFTDYLTQRLFDNEKIGLWGHSNGGQIALSVLEITGQNIPTTLWAPVSKPFPYSVLYYTDESDDGGQYIRRALSEFENGLNNNVEDYSILTKPTRIIAPIQIHQGGEDDAVPLYWSEQLAEILNEAEVEVTLYRYPAADHNLVPNWEQVVQRDIQFFNRELKNQ